MYHLHFAAFYADCERAIRPVKSGHRLVLVYNLAAQGATGELEPGDNRPEVAAALAAIRAWSDDADGGPSKLVMPLGHRYSSEGFGFDVLKGEDFAAVDVLRQAAKVPDRTPFHFHLGRVEHLEIYSTKEDNYIWNYTSEFVNMIAPPEESIRYDMLEYRKSELEDYSWDVQPDGDNRSAVERWDGHAALIVWPHSHHWDIVCRNGIERAIEEVAAVAQAADDVRDALEEALASSGQLSQGEAATILELVMEHGHVAALEELQLALRTICKHAKRLAPELGESLTQLLVKYGDVEMAKIFLSNCSISANSSVVPALASRFGWANLQNEVVRLLERLRASGGLDDCLELLLSMATPESASTEAEAADWIIVQTGADIRNHELSEAGGIPEGKTEWKTAAENGGGRGGNGGGKRRKTELGWVQEGRIDSQAGQGGKGMNDGLIAENYGAGSASEGGVVLLRIEATDSPPAPWKLTKEEQEREAVCRGGIVRIVEELVRENTPDGDC